MPSRKSIEEEILWTELQLILSDIPTDDSAKGVEEDVQGASAPKGEDKNLIYHAYLDPVYPGRPLESTEILGDDIADVTKRAGNLHRGRTIIVTPHTLT